jgi:hypothetical protein
MAARRPPVTVEISLQNRIEQTTQGTEENEKGLRWFSVCSVSSVVCPCC